MSTSIELDHTDAEWATSERAEVARDAFLLGYPNALTAQTYRIAIDDWINWCWEEHVDPLTERRTYIDGFRAHLATWCSAATIAKKLSALSSYYTWAMSEDLVSRNPVALVKRPRPPRESPSTGLTAEELAKVTWAARKESGRDWALLRLLGYNGLRISEALNADIEDLATERDHVVLHIARKGGARATIPLSEPTRRAVMEAIGDRVTGPIFVNYKGERLSRSGAEKEIKWLGHKALRRNIHAHDFRHAFVTLALDAGATLRDVQDAAGHASADTTRRYDRARHNLDRHPTYLLDRMWDGLWEDNPETAEG